jgi:hypothetical protein
MRVAAWPNFGARVQLALALFALGLTLVWLAVALAALADPPPAHGVPVAPFRWTPDELVA